MNGMVNHTLSHSSLKLYKGIRDVQFKSLSTSVVTNVYEHFWLGTDREVERKHRSSAELTNKDTNTKYLEIIDKNDANVMHITVVSDTSDLTSFVK